MFKYLIKLCSVTLITLVVLILVKQNNNIKNIIYDNVYDKNISFAYINSLYKKYFGNNDFLDNKINLKPVFNEKLVYSNKDKYLDGLKLSVDEDYLIPSLESGLVVFTGTKEGYGNVVIIEQVDGVDVWYGNLTNINVKLYDYIEKGSLIGNCDKELYLVFKHNGEILDYEEKI